MFSIKRIIALLLLVKLFAVSGCTHNISSADDSERILIFNADKDINPNEFNQPAPLNVFIYQLRAVERFQDQQDDFFSSSGGSADGFAKDIISVREIIIRPGEEKEVSLQSAPEEVAIGIVAAFRNINKSQWKRLIVLPVHKKRSWYQIFSSSEAKKINFYIKELSVDAKTME